MLCFKTLPLTQISIIGPISQETMVYPYKGILFGHKKGGNSGTCCIVDEPRGHHAERSQTQQSTYCVTPLIREI